MVESSRAKINFTKLSTDELSLKISQLVSDHGRVIFWKSLPRYFEGRATFFEEKNHIYLLLERTGISIRVLDEVICLNFTLNKIDYFLRGKIVEQNENSPQIKIEIAEECFRVEKRSRERLLTYPVHEVYAYLKYKKRIKNTNVIHFNKAEQANRNFFSEIDNYQKNKIASMSDELNTNEEEDIIGFRVEDLSSTGLSFFATSKEKTLVLDEIENNPFSLVLNFGVQVFNLSGASIVYQMNYINSQFNGIPMYKVGINFKLNPDLRQKIENISGSNFEMIDYQKEFEEFIKNE